MMKRQQGYAIFIYIALGVLLIGVTTFHVVRYHAEVVRHSASKAVDVVSPGLIAFFTQAINQLQHGVAAGVTDEAIFYGSQFYKRIYPVSDALDHQMLSAGFDYADQYLKVHVKQTNKTTITLDFTWKSSRAYTFYKGDAIARNLADYIAHTFRVPSLHTPTNADYQVREAQGVYYAPDDTFHLTFILSAVPIASRQ